MDAPGGRDKRKELDPRVAGELERRPARAGQPNPRTPRDEGSAAPYVDRAEPRDDAVEDGG